MDNKAYRPLNFKINNASDVAVIDIDGFIGRDMLEEHITGEASQNTVEALKGKLREVRASKIIVNINSSGGDLNDGLVIKDLLQQKGAEIVTNIQGFSASAATVIGQAGTKRRMSENAFMLIHRVMFGLVGYFNQNTFRVMTKDAEVIDSQLVQMYGKSSNKSGDEIEALMDEGEGYGRWINAEEALEYGFIDEIYDPSDETDENIDKLKADEVSKMKRNVQELAIQGYKGSEDFMNRLFKKEELQSEADSAKEARTRNLINKLKLEV